jgi:hypothetical protein
LEESPNRGIADRIRGGIRRDLVIRSVLVTAICTAVLVAIALSPDDLPPGPKLTHYRQNPLSFTYPASWNVEHYSERSSFSDLIVELSSQPMHDPCAATSSGSGQVCRLPVTELRQGSVLVEWAGNGFPGWTLEKAPGVAQSIGGRPARVEISRPGTCQSIGAQETINAFIAMATPDNYYSFTACIRGPDVAGTASSVLRSLRSTKFLDEALN